MCASRDVDSSGLLAEFVRLAGQGLARPFVIVPVSEESGPLDGLLLDRVGVHEGDVLDFLTGIRRLETIYLVVMGVGAASSDDCDLLGTAAAVLRRKIDETRAQITRVRDIRLHMAVADTKLPNPGVLSAAASANVIVIPHDRSSDTAQARLLSDAADPSFGSHVAVELLTLLGLWSGADTVPVDAIMGDHGGDNTPSVSFSRSMIRALVCPALPLHEIVPEQQPLPAPPGFVPTPSPAATVRMVAERALPEALQYRPDEEPAWKTTVSLWTALRLIPATAGDIVKSLPSVVRNGVGSTLTVLVGDGIQDVIGRESWLQIAFPNREEASDALPWEARAQNAMSRFEREDRMPVLTDVPEHLWRDLIERVLGVADGSRSDLAAGEATAQNRFVIVEPTTLGLRPEATPRETARQLVDLVDGVTENESPVVAQVGFGWESVDVPPGASSEAQSDDLDAPTDEALSALPPPDQLRVSLRDRLGSAGESSIPPGGLLGAVTIELANEIEVADRHCTSTMGRLAAIFATSRSQSTGGVPKRVKVLLAGALMMTVFAVCVFTGIAKWTSFEWVGYRTWIGIWALLTLVVLVPAFIVIGSSRKARSAKVVAAMLWLFGALYLSFSDRIRSSEIIVERFGRNYWPMWPLTFAVIVLVVVARRSGGSAPGRWRSALAAITVWLGCGYALFLAVVSASSSYSLLQPERKGAPERSLTLPHLSDDSRRLILSVSLAVATLAVLLGILMYCIFWLRVTYAARSANERFAWLVDQAKKASRSRRRTQSLISQWLGTAAALSMIIWHPLGRARGISGAHLSDVIHDDDLRKFDVAGLELSHHGHQLLMARLRSLVVAEGWLVSQYRRAAQAYMARSPEVVDARTSLSAQPVPETCERVFGFDEVLEGRVAGRRWGFANALYLGELDEALSEAIAANPADRVFESVIRDARVHRTTGAMDEDASLTEFFEAVLPSAVPTLPIGLSNLVFTADDARRQMRSIISWPQGLLSRQIDHALLTPSIETGLVEGAVLLAARCDLSERFDLHEIEGVTWTGGDDLPPGSPDDPQDGIL